MSVKYHDQTVAGLTEFDTAPALGSTKAVTSNGIATALAGKQDTLTIDNSPASGSSNPVSSNGVYNDVRTRVPNHGMGKNLLRNWYFVGGGTGRGVFPVNQRGATSGSISVNIYFIDCWKTSYGGGVVSNPGTWALSSNGLTYTPQQSSTLMCVQSFDDELFNGKQLTASVLYSDGSLICGTITRVTGTTQQFDSDDTFRMTSTEFRLYIRETKTVVAVKLELGTQQTLAHLEGATWVLNEIPDYEEELIKCQTSTADPNDTYANKSIATEQELAYVENGTKASRAYAIGEYFCWRGLLYRAKTAILSNADFTNGTNCEAVSGGGINEFHVAIATGALTSTRTADASVNAGAQIDLTFNYTPSVTFRANGQVTLYDTSGIPVGFVPVFMRFNRSSNQILARLLNTSSSVLTISTTAKASFFISGT